jgi:hypothetical protein
MYVFFVLEVNFSFLTKIHKLFQLLFYIVYLSFSDNFSTTNVKHLLLQNSQRFVNLG